MIVVGGVDMGINFKNWVKEYERNHRENNISIRYKNNNGELVEEHSPYFESISQVLQGRGFLLKDEFVNICEWKSKRPQKRYKSNGEKDIKERTKIAISEHPNTEKQIKGLIELNGVGVPVASAILTVIFPEDYCVIDYRAWRALLWVLSEFSFKEYNEFSEVMDNFRSYRQTDSYVEYLKKIRTLANQNQMTPRKIEMALWMYDKKRGVLNGSD